MKRNETKVSKFVCLECRKTGMLVQRFGSQSREKGHVKDLHCIFCNKTTHQMELRDNGSDLSEYNQDPEKYIQKYLKKGNDN